MQTTKEISEKQSERIFWVIQTVFGFIIARSFSDYGSAYLPPNKDDLVTVSLALIAVYGCVLWSWIDYSYSLIVSPYDFKKKFEKIRFVADLFIVLAYTYILIYISEVKKSSSVSLFPFLLAFATIYAGYNISGILRIIAYGRRASRIGLITYFLLAFIILSAIYKTVISSGIDVTTNRLFLVNVILINLLYRLVRARVSKRSKVIGVDIDGVLANQIDGLLPIIKSKLDVSLSYQDVTEWRLPIADTSIDKLIARQQEQRSFVIDMPVHRNAQKEVAKLIWKYRIAITTARSPDTDSWTKQWLDANNIPYDIFYNLKEGNKHNSAEPVDILIDDYQGNIINFLDDHIDKSAVLFSQPWNTDRAALNRYIENGRLVCVDSWTQVPKAIEKLQGKAT